MTGDDPPPPVPFREAVGAWARIAAASFGGPAGQIGVIHRVVVDEKRWLSEPRFLHALGYCMLLPGPEAQQLVTYVGWLLHGTRGALVAGLLFILPGFLAILGLSLLYVGWRDTAVVSAVLWGLRPAVLAVVVEALLRLRRRALRDRAGAALAAAAFLAVFAMGVPFPVVIAGAAVAGWALYGRGGQPLTVESTALRGRPSVRALLRTASLWLAIWLVPVGALIGVAGAEHVLAREAVFFSQVAVVTFGGAYAVLSYVARQAVEVQGWLQPGEMLDGLGMAETTPGPLIMVVQFVGFLGAWRRPGGLDPLVAGLLGSLITTWVTFAPCFLFILAGAPWVEHLRGSRVLNGALSGIMAAVVGVVANLCAWFGLNALFGTLASAAAGPFRLAVPVVSTIDGMAVAIAVLALVALVRFRAGMLAVLVGGAAAGLVVDLL